MGPRAHPAGRAWGPAAEAVPCSRRPGSASRCMEVGVHAEQRFGCTVVPANLGVSRGVDQGHQAGFGHGRLLISPLEHVSAGTFSRPFGPVCRMARVCGREFSLGVGA